MRTTRNSDWFLETVRVRMAARWRQQGYKRRAHGK